MANKFVGFERVPNVYIKKIVVSDYDQLSNKIEISIQINDRINGDTGTFHWSSNPMYFSYLKVAVITTSHVPLSSQIKLGNIIPIPEEIKQSLLFGDKTHVKTIGVNDFQCIKDDFSRTYIFTCSYVVEKSLVNYDVYATPYIDMGNLTSYLKMSVSEQVKLYYGSTTSESIIKNGKLNNQSNLFMLPNRKVWPGPVHEHNGVYMAGAVHTERPHPTLRKMAVSNIKLIDNRKTNKGARAMPNREKSPIISGLWHSINDNLDLSGIFSINLNQLAIEKTKLGGLFWSISPYLLDQFANSIEIKNIRVIREGVITRRTSNSAGTAVISTKRAFFPTVVENVQRIYVNNPSGVITYQFNDESSHENDMTQYKYRIEVMFLDKSQDFMRSRIQLIDTQVSSLVSIVTSLNNVNAYNYTRKKLVISPPTSRILDIVNNYYRTLAYFENIDQSEIRNLTNMRMRSFAMENYSPNSGLQMVQDFKNLQIKLLSSVGSDVNYRDISFLRKNIQKSSNPGIIEINKNWENIVIFAENKSSYDYLGKQSPSGLTNLTISEMASRGDREVKRYFNTDKSLDTEEMNNLDIKTKSAIKDIQSSKNRFFSPLSFKHGKTKVGLDDLANVDTQNLSSMFLKSKEEKEKIKKPFRSFAATKAIRNKKPNRKGSRKGRSQRKTNKRNFNSLYSIKRVRQIIKINHIDPLKPTITSATYVGDNSEFVDGEANYNTPAPEQEVEKVTNALKSSLKVNTLRNKFDFDLTAPGNAIDTFINSDRFSVNRLKKAPIQFKALVASRSEAAKNNILKSEGDILKDAETKILTEMTFQATQKVQMLSGYKKDKNGLPMLNSPLWIDLDLSLLSDDSSVICRMIYNEMPEFNLKTNEDFKMPVQNAYFTISDKNTTTQFANSPNDYSVVRDYDEAYNNDLSKYITYATSNIVKQYGSDQPMQIYSAPTTQNRQRTLSSSPSRVPRGTSGGGGSGGSSGGGGY